MWNVNRNDKKSLLTGLRVETKLGTDRSLFKLDINSNYSRLFLNSWRQFIINKHFPFLQTYHIFGVIYPCRRLAKFDKYSLEKECLISLCAGEIAQASKLLVCWASKNCLCYSLFEGMTTLLIIPQFPNPNNYHLFHFYPPSIIQLSSPRLEEPRTLRE